jgi:hypothetical protein
LVDGFGKWEDTYLAAEDKPLLDPGALEALAGRGGGATCGRAVRRSDAPRCADGGVRVRERRRRGRLRAVTRAIVDTGPLVAFLNTRDPHHAWARETFDTFRLPLVTCEAVLSEAWFLVRRAKGGQNGVLGLVSRGVLALDFSSASA